MADQDAMGGLLEGFALEFGLEEVHLVVAQLREVVETGINRGVVRLVFAAIEQDEAGVTPVKGTIGLVVVVADEAVHAGRVVIAYFVVATQEDDGLFGTVHRVGQAMDEADGVVAIGRFGQTVAVEDDEVVRHSLD